MSAASSSVPVAPVTLIAGLQLALRVLIGSGLVWLLVRILGNRDPLWAMISVVIVSDAQLDATVKAFRFRALNTIIGCAVGLAFLYVLGPASWSILLAMAAAVLISTSSEYTLYAWRIAPVTVVLVMMPGILQSSRVAGTPIAIKRTEDVLLGSAVAVIVSWIFYVVALARRRTAAQERASS
ncbi:MAG: FUSC family protein [Candidatus Acidiferrales bacterium]